MSLFIVNTIWKSLEPAPPPPGVIDAHKFFESRIDWKVEDLRDEAQDLMDHARGEIGHALGPDAEAAFSHLENSFNSLHDGASMSDIAGLGHALQDIAPYTNEITGVFEQSQILQEDIFHVHQSMHELATLPEMQLIEQSLSSPEAIGHLQSIQTEVNAAFHQAYSQLSAEAQLEVNALQQSINGVLDNQITEQDVFNLGKDMEAVGQNGEIASVYDQHMEALEDVVQDHLDALNEIVHNSIDNVVGTDLDFNPADHSGFVSIEDFHPGGGMEAVFDSPDFFNEMSLDVQEAFTSIDMDFHMDHIAYVPDFDISVDVPVIDAGALDGLS